MTRLLREEQPDSETLPPYPVRRWTLEEYHALIEQGIFDEERVELLEGWIVPKMTRNPPHDATVVRVDGILRPLLPPSSHLRVQLAVTMGNSEVEPDLAIVAGDVENYEESHPDGEDVLLLVEIADTSLKTDRRKTSIYATGGVAEVWIVDIQNRQLETYSHPIPEQGEYQVRHLYCESESLSWNLGEKRFQIPVERFFARRKESN